LAKVARVGATDFARRFIAGSDTQEVIQTARRLRRSPQGFTLDILGEAVTSQQEADRYFQAYADLITTVAPSVNDWSEITQVDCDPIGQLPRMNLSVKLSALDPHFDPIDTEGVLERVGGRFRELLRIAREHRAFINVDMESYEKKALTLKVFKTILSEKEFVDTRDVGIVIQCYLKDSAHDFVLLRDWARQRGTPVWVRLVKGAYWEHETVLSQSLGWPVPVYQQKWQSDANYERQIRFVMQNTDALLPAIGSHNLRSIAHALATAEHVGLAKNAYEIQMLYGMADAEKQSLIQRGHRVRVYMPYGELIPGMAYLVRRLLENTSNDSFLRAGVKQGVSVEHLLTTPTGATQDVKEIGLTQTTADRGLSNEETDAMNTKATFVNEPPVDFSIDANRARMQQALEKVESQFGRSWPLVIRGENVAGDGTLEVCDPSNSNRILGTCEIASSDHVDVAVAAAKDALTSWSKTHVRQRAELLNALADEMKRRFFELSAWEVFECGKPWREATNDICEAIDFCRFYAAGAVEMQRSQGADVAGEENRFSYSPRGVAGVIAPWNFPLAILTGMTTAALATGNTVVIKPAEQSSLMGSLFMEMVGKVGFPNGVVNLLQGQGEVVGAGLVHHPDVALIAFTGSRAVGLAINAAAAKVSAEGSPFVKRVIAEMGGKNAIIIDRDADLDEAVLGVNHSAFGFQGQKCSACSRVIVLEDVYDQFVNRLIESARSLVVGPAKDPATQVGPLIDREAQQKAMEYIEIGKTEGECGLETEVGELAEHGCFVGPHIFTEILPHHRLAQEEVFGPVLAVIRVANLDEAISVANGTDYALTGGLYSRNPGSLERVKQELIVGNLYLNRNITGALVGRQPFGGFKMSGIGSKAGGNDYLLQFVVPRTITENTMRRGFAPNIEVQE
ncbi:MAG: bifunctional proline dehydrogenase/L-glutamate gamma-semialdehyde dehydrogenase, partial [Planctomycetota bacterium]|nr:bifunctional proline dehydrogenase/L-glutamate gamma-semialdehyde dehydrogenase [Planctomycetota bacterium]